MPIKANIRFGGWRMGGLNPVGHGNADQGHIACQDLVAQVNAAHREWVAAQSYFQEVSDPALVDVAIYQIEAARRKYMHLVNQIRARRSREGPVGQEGQ